MKNTFNKKLVVTSLVALFLASSAEADVSQCKYKIYAKSTSTVAPIGSFEIDNSPVIFKGRSLNTNNDAGFARLAAARAAEICFKAMLSKQALPAICTPSNRGIETGQGRALRLNISNLKLQAYQQVCSKVYSTHGDIGNRRLIPSRIFTKTTGSEAKKRECSLPASADNIPQSSFGAAAIPRYPSFYKVWDKSSLICKSGRLTHVNFKPLNQLR